MDDAAAAINLIGSVVRLVPAIKNATRNMSVPGARGLGGGGAPNTAPTAVHPALPRVDPERERRAYETVNFVLRTLGSRIGEAGMVSVPALAKALTEATQSIDVKLFSIETNRLFESLASKLNDPVLVNSVFTSIYLISFLTAELQGSLPNYKESYTPLGPKLVQQLFMAAIGSDAFRENQTANLDAYQTLARTAGLLRPTDLERATFPGFPSFRPCRYSSKTFKDTRNHRMAYERLVKHFETYGFPQPVKGQDVGMIKDWRFLSGDSNTRAFEVEKADKHIGENFGRVLHWLICSADRMPPGEAVIAYLDQHIELIKWMGSRMGYCAVIAATDLNLSGPHATLKKELRDIFNTWVVLMPSETAKASRRQSSAQWAQALQRPTPSQQSSYTSIAQRTPSIGSPISPVGSNVSSMPDIQRTPSVGTPISPVGSTVPAMPNIQRRPSAGATFAPTDRSPQQAQLNRVVSVPSTYMTPTVEEEGSPIPMRPVSIQSQSEIRVTYPNTTKPLESIASQTTPGIPGPTEAPSAQKPVAVPLTPSLSLDLSKAPVPSQSASPITSPPPYSPSPANAYPFPAPRPASVVRRKAPPRPKKKLVLAKALDDFEPEDNNDEELPFKAGDILEIVEKSAALEEEGWCRARLKDGVRIGLAPLDYLEEVGPAAQEVPGAMTTNPGQITTPSSPPVTSLGAVPEHIHELGTQSPELTFNPAHLQSPQIGQQDAFAPVSAPDATNSAAHSGPNHASALGAGNSQLSSPQDGSPNLSATSDPGITGKFTGAALAHVASQHATAALPQVSTHNSNYQTAHQTPLNITPQTGSQSGSGLPPFPPLSSSQALHARPPVGRPPSQSTDSSQSAANLPGSFQNSSMSHPAAAGTPLNWSNQTVNGPPVDGGFPPQSYGIQQPGPPMSNYGMMPTSGYPMAAQPTYGYPMPQPMYNNNNSGDDALMQMLAMQTVAGMTQPSTAPAVSPPPMDASGYNDPTSNSFGGNAADPGYIPSATPANNFGGQKDVDTNGTDPIVNVTTDSSTDPTTDLNSLPLSTPATDPNDLCMPPATEPSPPLADSSSLYLPPDPTIIVLPNSAADVAAVDPFYASMDPELNSSNTFGDQQVISPLASLSPMPPPSFDSSAGLDTTTSPLAGMVPIPDTTSTLAGSMQETAGSNAALASIDGIGTEEVEMQETTVVTQDTTIVSDADTGTDEQYADDQVDYVMDATACSEDWDV